MPAAYGQLLLVGYPPPPSGPGRVPPSRPGWVPPHLDLAGYPLSGPGWVSLHLNLAGYPPTSGSGWVPPSSGPGWVLPPVGYPPWLDLARYPPPPVWTDRWMNRHVSKHYLPVILRTRAVITNVTLHNLS